MACFIVPGIEAALVTAANKLVKNSEANNTNEEVVEEKVINSRSLKTLSTMLWGGSGLLAFEHVWHGEVSPFFPFLTAMSSKEEMLEMFTEMSTVGVAMAVSVTAVWGIGSVVASKLRKKYSKEVEA